MSRSKTKKKGRVMWGFIYVVVFLAAFLASAVMKMTADPEKQLASWTAIRCSSEHILDYIELDSEYSIFEVKVPEEWNGKSILELDIRKKYGINILGIRERGILDMNVTPDSVLGKRDSVLVLGQPQSVQKCFHI